MPFAFYSAAWLALWARKLEQPTTSRCLEDALNLSECQLMSRLYYALFGAVGVQEIKYMYICVVMYVHMISTIRKI